MALTTAIRGPNVINIGQLKLKIFKCTFTSVTGGEIKSGFGQVIGAIYVPETSDNHGQVFMNSASAAATEDDFGSVYVDSVTSNDVGYLYIIGA